MPSLLPAILNHVLIVGKNDMRVVGLGAVVLCDILGCDMPDLKDKVLTIQLRSLLIHCGLECFVPYNLS